MLDKFKKLLLPNALTKYYFTFKPVGYKESIKILNTDGSNRSILENYKNLMRINHPDLGGSPYICAKINEAKNFLIEHNKSLYEIN